MSVSALLKNPTPLAFNHNNISNQRYISHSTKSSSQSTQSNTRKRLTKNIQKNISWIVLGCIVATISLSNFTHADNKSTTLLLSGIQPNLGGPEETSSMNGVMGVPGTYGTESNFLQASLINVVENNTNEANGNELTEESQLEPELPILTAFHRTSEDSREESRVIRTYTVQDGETLNEIADKFGITAETIAITNDLDDLNTVEVNTTLTILPVDGIKINSSEDERSIEELARVYQVSEEKIREFNGIDDEATIASLIIPEAVVPNTEKPFYVAPPVRTATSRAPARQQQETRGYFALPTTGKNWGVIHSNNGVDVANSCGTPIYASADGVVTVSRDGWNGGYGSYIHVTHPNGVVTVYAHLSQRNAQVGQSVSQGELIGLMGTTGRSTGCHLHFEVRGARNPLAR